MSALALLLALGAAAAPVRRERLVLRTDAGDLAIAPFAGAPRHADKLAALFASGAYDTAPLFKVDAARLVHVGGVGRRAVPLPPAALGRIRRLPLEPGAAPHRAGTVAMAHDPADPDPLETSFVILLADMPAMDGRFTAVGSVVGGEEVLAALRRVRVGSDGSPVRPLRVLGTETLRDAAALERASLRGPDRRALGLEADESFRRGLLLFAALAGALGAAAWGLRARLGRAAAGLGLLAVLAGFFAAFAAGAEGAARGSPGLGLLLFAGAVGVFRLMNEFER